MTDIDKIPNGVDLEISTPKHVNNVFVDENKPLLLPQISSSRPIFIKKGTNINPEDAINLADEIRGALIIKLPIINYTIRVYLHYWLWQIPVLIANIILFCIWNTTHTNPEPTIALTELGFLAVGPVFLSALIRDKIFLWFVYWLVKKSKYCGCSKYARYHVSRLADCIGGIHSSMGCTSLVWNIIYSIGAFIREDYSLNARSLTAFSLPILLLIICFSAIPCLRFYYHNSFEIIHRYLNWLALCFLITHVTLVNIKQAPTILGSISSTPTIITILILLLTVYPWIILHRTKGKDIKMIVAKEATAYIFPFSAPMGAVCKLSIDFVEFHVLGITPLPYDNKVGHKQCFALVKSLGDWTKSLNDKAKIDGLLDNTTFYMSRIKPPNFTQGLFNWNRVFVLCTGAGIAPLIPYVVNDVGYLKVEVHLVWVARDHSNNYPKFIVDLLRGLPNVRLLDTSKTPRHARKNLCLLTVEEAQKCNAEAVFIVSNPSTAYQVSNYVLKQGIPTFASNFDV